MPARHFSGMAADLRDSEPAIERRFRDLVIELAKQTGPQDLAGRGSYIRTPQSWTPTTYRVEASSSY